MKEDDDFVPTWLLVLEQLYREYDKPPKDELRPTILAYIRERLEKEEPDGDWKYKKNWFTKRPLRGADPDQQCS